MVFVETKQGPLRVLLSLSLHVAPLSGGNYCFAMSAVKGLYARTLQLHTFLISVFSWGKSNATAIKHAYNESLNFVASHAIDIDITGPRNNTEIAQVIGMEAYGVMRSPGSLLRYTLDYMTPDIYSLSLINPLRAKFFWGNINIYLHFMSFLHIDLTQVRKILPQVRPGLIYST